jgi:hypothetical protein
MTSRVVTVGLFLTIIVGTPFIPAPALSSADHASVTIDKAESAGFSAAAAEVLARGAEIPDFTAFRNPAAHAQTANGDDGKPTQTREQAEQACEAYLYDLASEFDTALKAGHGGSALLYLGAALHAIQDFASHQGMTNAEHSYLSYDANPRVNPDMDSQNIDLAKQYTTEFLSAVHQVLGDERWKQLTTYNQTTFDVVPERFRTWNTDPITVAQYHHMGTKFLEQDKIRWDQPSLKVVEGILIESFLGPLYPPPAPPSGLSAMVC